MLADGGFVLGAEVAEFEREFALYCGVEHCVGVNSGTAALSLSLMGAGIGPGDEVVVPGHTFVASALAVAHVGATPVFCDVELETGLIDPDAAAAAIGPRTAALVAVHLYGQACRMDRLLELAERRGLFLLEDAAQAHGATYRGQRVGGLGGAAAFSFYPSKNLGALGDGGAICTNDDVLAAQLRRLRNLGQSQRNDHVTLGVNERLDGMQAAFLRVKLRRLTASNARRKRHAERYRLELPRQLAVVSESDESPSVHHIFAIRTPARESLAAHLAKEGIGTAVHYPRAAHEHPLWDAALEGPRPSLPNAERWAAEELSLPMFAELRNDEIDRVVEACQAWATRRSATCS
jgi:dTDP-4-amino-4,6-dideoxygalactose transaminase